MKDRCFRRACPWFRPIADSALIILLVAFHGPAGAQEVRGRVLESGTRQPLLLVTVALLDSAFAVIDRTYTDETGAFVLRAKKPGGYFVLSDRVGYKRTLDGILELGAGGRINVDFYLRPQPVALDTISVAITRERTDRFLESMGFYERLNERSACRSGTSPPSKCTTGLRACR